MKSTTRSSSALAAGLLVACGALAGPAVGAGNTPAETGAPVAIHTQPPAQGTKILAYDYQRQPNYYYCAPAATRIALSTQGKLMSQKDVAEKLGTTRDGTDSVDSATRVLNDVTGGGYETTEIASPTANAAQVGKLRADVVEAVDARRGVVANTIGTAADTAGKNHSFPGGHYVSVVGYRDGGEEVKIADPYARSEDYWMTAQELGDWIAERGYAS